MARITEARDVLPGDDVRHFAFGLTDPAVYVLISRDDATHVRGDAYFVWRMLDPGRAGGDKCFAFTYHRLRTYR